MDDTADQILGAHRIMAISTIRADGAPHATLVGYAHEGPVLYFLIFRGSEKFANLARDKRVSIAIGSEPRDMRLARAVYADGHAEEIMDSAERQHGWQTLIRQHPNLAGSALPNPASTALMKAICDDLTVLDYSKGLGHSDALHFNEEAKSD